MLRYGVAEGILTMKPKLSHVPLKIGLTTQPHSQKTLISVLSGVRAGPGRSCDRRFGFWLARIVAMMRFRWRNLLHAAIMI